MFQEPECVDNLLLYSLDAASKIFRHEPILDGLDTHSLEIFSKLGQISIVWGIERIMLSTSFVCEDISGCVPYHLA